MSGYVRSIRSIESSQQYSAVQAVNRYAQFDPMREVVEGGRMAPPSDWWDKEYAEAAGGAAEWLGLARKGVRQLTDMQRELGGRGGIEHPEEVHNHLLWLSSAINAWEGAFRNHRRHLRDEVWAAMELALRHPAVEALGLRQRGDSVYKPVEKEALPDVGTLKRLLLGADGLLNELKTGLSYGEQHQAANLLKLPFHSAYPYAMYYGAAQSFWPLPNRGLLLNKYI